MRASVASKLPVDREAVRKTELCARWVSGRCPFGERCQFAHGATDLRQRERPHLYKTKLCNKFLETNGNCPYKQRCNFIHAFELPKTEIVSDDQPVCVAIRDVTTHVTSTPHTTAHGASGIERAAELAAAALAAVPAAQPVKPAMLATPQTAVMARVALPTATPSTAHGSPGTAKNAGSSSASASGHRTNTAHRAREVAAQLKLAALSNRLPTPQRLDLPAPPWPQQPPAPLHPQAQPPPPPPPLQPPPPPPQAPTLSRHQKQDRKRVSREMRNTPREIRTVDTIGMCEPCVDPPHAQGSPGFAAKVFVTPPSSPQCKAQPAAEESFQARSIPMIRDLEATATRVASAVLD